jgi:hypothetical protein
MGIHPPPVPSAMVVDAPELPVHPAVAAASAKKARHAHAARILGSGGGAGKGKQRTRRDAISDRQHAALKRSAARFFFVKAPDA